MHIVDGFPGGYEFHQVAFAHQPIKHGRLDADHPQACGERVGINGIREPSKSLFRSQIHVQSFDGVLWTHIPFFYDLLAYERAISDRQT
ncbi:MAG: hypothetical protein MZV63_13085 [Marinilabiliales bacterium]|nr:hypothetical protein [Marinilabiliales bacterium]